MYSNLYDYILAEVTTIRQMFQEIDSFTDDNPKGSTCEVGKMTTTQFFFGGGESDAVGASEKTGQNTKSSTLSTKALKRERKKPFTSGR